MKLPRDLAGAEQEPAEPPLEHLGLGQGVHGPGVQIALVR